MDSFVPKHDSFFLTLTSGSSTKKYPKNTSTSYFNQLPISIDLRHGEWEVGLSDISMPSKWENVTDSYDTFIVKMVDLDFKYEIYEGTLNVKTVITKDNSGKSLYHKVIKQMHKSINNEKVKDAIEFQIEIVKNQERFVVKFKEPNGETFVKFPKVYCDLLGLDSNVCDKWLTGETIVGVRPLDPTKRRLDTCEFPPFYLRQMVKRDTPLTLMGHECTDNLLYQTKTYQLQHGMYENISSILNGMKECLSSRTRQYFDFEQNNNGVVTLLCGLGVIDETKPDYHISDHQKFLRDNFTIIFPKNNPGLGLMLGFDNTQIDKELTHKTCGKHIADINRGIQNLFVNTSLIKRQIIGDKWGDLLRRIPRPENNKNNITYDLMFNPINYYPLTKQTFDVVDIDITTDAGSNIPFQLGKTITTLHFRRFKDV